MTRRLAVAFANIGRGTEDQTVRAVATIRDHVATLPGPAVLALVEVDEGDRADEHGLISSAFRTWEAHHWRTRNPILTRAVTVQHKSSRIGSQGVPHQSPRRRINEVVIDGGDDPDIAVLCLHAPPGARNGWRPADIKARLRFEYRRLWKLLRKRIRRHHRAGRHVIVLMDANWRRMRRLHRRAGVLIKHGPDYIVAVPARGWECPKRPTGWVPLPIEPLHGLLWAEVQFRPVKEPLT